MLVVISLFGHPSGTLAGAKAMRQSIDNDFAIIYQQETINKWGLKKK